MKLLIVLLFVVANFELVFAQEYNKVYFNNNIQNSITAEITHQPSGNKPGTLQLRNYLTLENRATAARIIPRLKSLIISEPIGEVHGDKGTIKILGFQYNIQELGSDYSGYLQLQFEGFEKVADPGKPLLQAPVDKIYGLK